MIKKLDKFDAKSDEDIFFGYLSFNKAHRVFNRRILIIEESIHIVFNETNIFKSRKIKVDDNTSTLEKKMKQMSLEDIFSQDLEEKEKK